MPDQLETIVQRMIDAGEPEENIAQVIREYKPTTTAPTTYKNTPTSFAGGVLNSLTSGEALGAGLKGGLGWLKGATIDLPSTLVGGLKDIGQSISSPIQTARGGWGAITNPSETLSGLYNPIAESVARSGSDPESFGRMMGVATGQPLTTYGLAKAAPVVAPATARGVGSTVAGAGRVISKHKPVSGMLPRLVEPRIARTIEGAAGRGITKIGESLKRAGTPVKQVEAQVVPEMQSPWLEGEFYPTPQSPNLRTGLPPSETDIFAPPDIGMPALPPPRDMFAGQPVPPSPAPIPRTPTPSPPSPIQLGPTVIPPERQLPVARFGPSSLSEEEIIKRMARPGQEPITGAQPAGPAPIARNPEAARVAHRWGRPLEPEVLPAEVETDIFGIPKNRDITPAEAQAIQRQVLQRESQFMGPDTLENQAVADRLTGTINTSSVETDAIIKEITKALDEGFNVYPPGYKGSIRGRVVRTLSDGSKVIDNTPKTQPPSGPSIEVLDPYEGIVNNASGESVASVEELGRRAGMASKGQKFVVYDRAGRMREVHTDYKVRPGETFGVQSPSGFTTLDDMGGKVPTTPPKTKSKPRGESNIGKTYRVDKAKLTPEFLEKSSKNGFQLVGRTPAGDFIFKKIR